MTIVDTSSKVRKERITLCSAALFDVLLIALMFVMLASKFVLAPGFTIDVDKESLPSAKSPDASIVNDDLSVLNAKGNSMIIFDGAIFNTETFAKKMDLNKSAKSRGTLLIKADKNVDTQTLLDICAAARNGGFEKIHLATTPSQE